MTDDRARKKAIRAYAAEHGVSYNVARRALERTDRRQPKSEFTIGETVRVNGRRIVADHYAEVDPYTAREFCIHIAGIVEAAWARWAGPCDLQGGRAEIIALKCAYCMARTSVRCCDIAFCEKHRDQHQGIEHTAPEAGRYVAAFKVSSIVLDNRYGPHLARLPGISYPKDLTLEMASRARRGDAVRVIHHVRKEVAVPGTPDPIQEALLDVGSGDSAIPTPTRARWLATDILARCSWPAMAEALGDHDTAQWMRAQPPIVDATPTPLTERIYTLDRDIFGIGRVPNRTPVGELASANALSDLWAIAPNSVAHGALGYSGGVGDEVFSHALTLPDGPARVGKAVARAQHDAVDAIVTVIRDGRRH